MRNSKTSIAAGLAVISALVFLPALSLNGSYIIKAPPAVFPSINIGAFVQAATPNASGSSTTSAASFSGQPKVANVIMVPAITISGTNNVDTKVTDNQGNTYSRVAFGGSAANPVASFWCAVVVTSSGTFTVTITNNTGSSFQGIFPLEYSGMSCNPDKSASAIGNASPFSCGSITTANPNDIVFMFLGMSDGGGVPATVSYTPSAGFTTRASVTDGNKIPIGSVADQIRTATGTFAPTTTTNFNANNSPCYVVAMMTS